VDTEETKSDLSGTVAIALVFTFLILIQGYLAHQISRDTRAQLDKFENNNYDKASIDQMNHRVLRHRKLLVLILIFEATFLSIGVIYSIVTME
jgi:hypothetical protein